MASAQNLECKVKQHPSYVLPEILRLEKFKGALTRKECYIFLSKILDLGEATIGKHLSKLRDSPPDGIYVQNFVDCDNNHSDYGFFLENTGVEPEEEFCKYGVCKYNNQKVNPTLCSFCKRYNKQYLVKFQKNLFQRNLSDEEILNYRKNLTQTLSEDLTDYTQNTQELIEKILNFVKEPRMRKELRKIRSNIEDLIRRYSLPIHIQYVIFKGRCRKAKMFFYLDKNEKSLEDSLDESCCIIPENKGNVLLKEICEKYCKAYSGNCNRKQL